MSEKRRDTKGRILRDRESQCKDGRYRYTFYEGTKQKALYSWKLEKTDKLPAGKRECLSLREQEAELRKSQDKGLSFQGGGMIVRQLVKRYVATKTGVKETTASGYKTVMNFLDKDEFGGRRIDQVKVSDAKLWLIKLQQEDHRGYSSIHSIRGVVRPAFQMAVEDDLIIKNPFDFLLVTVVVNDSVTREAITRKQERQFLEFVRNDKHFCRYYDGIFLLFKTGLRISEFCGLTIKDIDLKARTITINHQLQRTRDMRYIIVDSAKTDAGTRVLPMSGEVYECCKRIIENLKTRKTEPMIDGKTGFLWIDKNGMPTVAMHWEKYFEHIVEKYNKIYRIQMPQVTPHVARHTYCSNMARSGMNPNTLKYLMGHSDISVTLNVYTHLGLEDAEAEIERLEKKA